MRMAVSTLNKEEWVKDTEEVKNSLWVVIPGN